MANDEHIAQLKKGVSLTFLMRSKTSAYGAHRRRGGTDRFVQHFNDRKRASLSSSARNRSDSYGGDTTSLTACCERIIASKIRRERSIASKRCLFGRCHCSGH